MVKQTSFRAPAAELLVQIERRRAVAQLDIRQPLCDNVQEGRVDANSRADDGHHEPGLASIVGLAHLAPPGPCAVLVPEPGSLPAFVSATGLLVDSILDPVDRCKVFVAFDLVDFLRSRRAIAVLLVLVLLVLLVLLPGARSSTIGFDNRRRVDGRQGSRQPSRSPCQGRRGCLRGS